MEKISKITELLLKEASWHPGRKYDFKKEVEIISESGFPVFDNLTQVLQEIGGLEISIKDYKNIFYLEGGEKCDIFHSHDQLFTFIPQKCKCVLQKNSSQWNRIDIIARNKLEIAPLGIYWAFNLDPFDIFIASNGNIFLGADIYDGSRISIPGLMFLGNDYLEAINSLVMRYAVYY